MTVGDFRKSVLANTDSSVQIFNFFSAEGKADEALTLG